MKSKILVATSLRSLKNHPLRSLLTTLGIIIGVISIIAVMSIGSGAENKITNEINQLGTNFIIVIAGAPKHHMSAGARAQGGHLTLKTEDIAAIENESEYIYKLSPGLQTSVTANFESENWKTTITGVSDNYPEIREWPLKEGRFFTHQEVRSSDRVAVLGETVRRELFGERNPIGQTIRIKGSPYKVVGLLTGKGKLPNGMDQDDMIFSPYSTVRKKVMGVKAYGAIIASAKSNENLAMASEEIRQILRQKHKLRHDVEDDFTIFSQDDISQAAKTASGVFNILLLIIASISLLVGGVGIMNIMLVTVTERTKEIGIRMALGATTSTILNQFILEALTICFSGGLVGAILGISISKIIGTLLGWNMFISIKSIIISILSCLFVGLFFGYYPARKASQLNPVEALADK